MRLGLRRSAALIAALLVLGSASAAAAATPIAGVGWEIKLASTLRNHLLQDCFLDLQRGGPDADRPWYIASDRAAGSWDPAARTWSVVGRGRGVLLDSFTQVQQHTGHAWAIDEVGFALRSGRVDITAEIRSAASRSASVTRRRIAVIAHPRIRPRIVHRLDRKGKDLGPLPNTFVIDVRGKATVAPAFRRRHPALALPRPPGQQLVGPRAAGRGARAGPARPPARRRDWAGRRSRCPVEPSSRRHRRAATRFSSRSARRAWRVRSPSSCPVAACDRCGSRCRPAR